jgi:hypothetical protein
MSMQRSKLMIFRNRTIVILDKAGMMIGTVVPPNHGSADTRRLGEMVHSLEEVTTSYAAASRGDFKCITTGIQKGRGSQVSGVLVSFTPRFDHRGRNRLLAP